MPNTYLSEIKQEHNSFILQFNNNLAKKTFEYLQQDAKDICKQFEKQKERNDETDSKRKQFAQINTKLGKELDRYTTIYNKRIADYENIVDKLRARVNDIKNNEPLINVTYERVNKNNRALSIEIESKSHLLSTEVKKLKLAEKEYDRQQMNKNSTQNSINACKLENENIKVAIEKQKNQLNDLKATHEEWQAKYEMATEVCDKLNKQTDELACCSTFVEKEKQSLRAKKLVHETVNAKLINIIITRGIAACQREGIQMMMKRLDELTEKCLQTSLNFEANHDIQSSYDSTNLQNEISQTDVNEPPRKNDIHRKKLSKSCMALTNRTKSNSSVARGDLHLDSGVQKGEHNTNQDKGTKKVAFAKHEKFL